MKRTTWTVLFVLLLRLPVCVALAGGQTAAMVEETSLPIIVERALGSLTISAEFGGVLLIDGVQVTTLDAGEEVTLRNVRVGARLVEIRGESDSISFLANVQRAQETGISDTGTGTLSGNAGGETLLLRCVRSLGGGLYFYDMHKPVFVVDTAVSYYLHNELAVGGFIGFDKRFGPGRSGLQVTFGDTQTFAVGLRAGYYHPDRVSLLGVSCYLRNAYFSLDYSFPDGCWAGEIHVLVGYSLRLQASWQKLRALPRHTSADTDPVSRGEPLRPFRRLHGLSPFCSRSSELNDITGLCVEFGGSSQLVHH